MNKEKWPHALEAKYFANEMSAPAHRISGAQISAAARFARARLPTVTISGRYILKCGDDTRKKNLIGRGGV